MAHVLVIDDDALERELLFEVLHGAGHDVVTAVDGSDGLEKLAAGPDLIVLDLMTPHVDGYDVLRAVRSNSRFAQTPVIVVSGVATGDWATRVGANRFLMKPFSPVELLQTIKELLGSGAP